MEKACHSSSSTTTSASGGGGDSSATIITTNSDNNRDAYLKHLNKISHKISKPIRKTPPPPPVFTQNDTLQIQEIPPPPPPPPVQLQNQGPQQAQQQQQQQHQPPVYNINKNDFRDVVQRLTGSPAHERFSTPPPIQPPKPPSSRLQRIRPPPLAQINNRPTPPPLPQISNPGSNNVLNCANPTVFLAGQRQPLSPLPPFPAVHAAAESPISAYMRFLQGSVSSAASPRWNNLAPVQMPPPPTAVHHHHQQQNIPPPPQGFPQFPMLPPMSPLPFGCIPSPRSPYALLSPSLLFSPTGQLGFPQLPLSPSLPVPSPRWKDI